ncbi:MAG: cell wall hydrolase [Eubacteriales bacterium]|nr:cell wall hydrolase [Eubacteriales bacterium]
MRWKRNGYGAFMMLLSVTVGLAVIVLCASVFTNSDSGTVYAVRSSSGFAGNQESGQGEGGSRLQAGLMGIVSSVNSMEEYSHATEKVSLENDYESILVGSDSVCRNTLNRLRVEQGTEKISEIGYYAQQTVRENHMASQDYYTLLKIVEAEATGGDMKSKILIANVVLNRVKDRRFPDTIYDVVWERTGNVVQFSPTADGRIDSVTITDETIEAVDRALAGEDYSQGALCFMARSDSDNHNIEWFDANLTLLFEYGGHEYFTFTD